MKTEQTTKGKAQVGSGENRTGLIYPDGMRGLLQELDFAQQKEEPRKGRSGEGEGRSEESVTNPGKTVKGRHLGTG